MKIDHRRLFDNFIKALSDTDSQYRRKLLLNEFVECIILLDDNDWDAGCLERMPEWLDSFNITETS